MDVAVIGAGAAGLVCARELLRSGASPAVFEAGDRVGGTWVYDDEAGGHGAMYASLRTNLPVDLMAFRDYPFDERGGAERNGPRFASHADVLRYLERFSIDFCVAPRIEFERAVRRLRPVDGRFVLDTGSLRTFDAVAICTGHYRRPFVPDLPGLDRFTGTVLHSHDYRRPEGFAGRRVALLGAKASGVDIAGDLVGHAEHIWLCGKDLEDAAPRAGIEHRSPVVATRGADLLLADGTTLHDVDALLLCTGYAYDFPFLDAPEVVHVEPKWVSPLWLDLMAVEAPAMAFVGLPFAVVPFALMELQARVFAHMLTGRIVRPRRATMLREHRSLVRELECASIPRRHFFKYGARQFEYVDALARRVGSSPLPDWYRPLYEATGAARRADPDGYRDGPLPISRDDTRDSA